MHGGAIYDDDLVYGGHAQIREGEFSAYLGYLMVETKRHIPSLSDLTDTEAQTLGLVIARLSQALKAVKDVEYIYAFVLGDRVPHLHVHVVSRYHGARPKYWGVHVNEWPDAPRGGPKEIEAICKRLRHYLK